ncbi:MAG: sugar kinase [Spirochaetes bacterium]|jgi:NAD kinase|nr:sugar kinase [Spirochaetota bacterium]
MFDKVVIVTKETQLEQLVKKFSSKSQAEFYIAQSYRAYRTASMPQAASAAAIKEEEKKIKAGLEEVEIADRVYRSALEKIKRAVPADMRLQHIDWTHLPNFLFSERDLVMALGQDGLVINTAKYLDGQPIFAVNPDPGRFDGVLLPFDVESASSRMNMVLRGEYDVSRITIAKATLNDGQEIYGVNDIFIGPGSHTSFRYIINHEGAEEPQSSSGIIVSTGAGSTGWFKSIIEGAMHVAGRREVPGEESVPGRFPWDSDYLYFTVREPFESRTSGCGIVFGRINEGAPVVITSQMPSGGVIFSDGIEKDFLEFNSGKIATVGIAEKKALLINRPD